MPTAARAGPLFDELAAAGGAGGADAGGRDRRLSRAEPSRAVLGAAEHCQGFPRCDRRTGARRASVAGSQAAGACRRPLVWDCASRARSVSRRTTLLFYGSLIIQVTAHIFLLHEVLILHFCSCILLFFWYNSSDITTDMKTL